ncbi:uncharacterized protein EV154DRAFT_493350 [Mucor mucedo]|uniref:uncharacterized protein n=1 Tax=Mucor mucedo TaxID=29922 RepID=UPI002220A550|nr:uncharacterized protein EV154DRAFT_493350 [Mucor mucedo]KAI7896052.1 hypothetical protein EV154DRAFT_493350 [Mucor mucedo]
MIKMTLKQDNNSLSPQHQHKKIDSVSATECANCGTTTTPLWRRGPNGETICNACGLYLKARNTLRPPTLKRTVHKKATPEPKNDCGGTCPGGGQCNGTGGSSSCAGCPAFNQHQVNRQALICANCRTTTTPLWRRDEQGNTICNACGLYYKLHNVHRPVSMKRSVIKRRKRIIVAQGSDEDDGEEEDEEMSPPPAVVNTNNNNNTTTTTVNPVMATLPIMATVPEIEDYVVLKKKKIELPHKKQQHAIISPPMTSPAVSSIRSSPPPPPPPTNQQTSPLSEKIYHNNNSNSNHSNTSPLFSKPYPEQQPNKSYLPPISSERQSYRLESLFGRRDSNSSIVTSSSTGTTLPPLSLPPLTPPLSQQQRQHLNHTNRISMSPPSIPIQQPSPPANLHIPSSHGGYELADFDMALDRLEHLRRQVRPEQANALSQLTQSITDLASKAEAILSLDSLAYGR